MNAVLTHDQLIERSRDWLFDSALPLWSQAGVNSTGGFREDLTFEGKPNMVETTRVRVQARQVFCYALAARMGWQAGADLARQGAHYLMKHGIQPSTGLPGMVIAHGHGLTDDKVDLYDVAFALFALTAAYATTGDEEINSAVFALLEALETSLRRPVEQGGYYETGQTTQLREQNPHMHLFEALLATAATTGREEVLALAQAVGRFAEQTFIRAPGQLRELAGPTVLDKDNRIEAGHHFEWVWLLHLESRLTGKPVSPHATGLFETATALTRADGRVPLSHGLDRTLKSGVLRTWTITEALKAYLATHRHAGDNLETKVTGAVAILFDDHLLDNGGWIDQRDAEGKQLSQAMPASTFYHVLLALYEFVQGREKPVFGRL